jgi:hypothetical protein
LNPIRPNFPPPVPTARPVRPEARAAQRAFFEAALTRTAATAPKPEPIRAAASVNTGGARPEPEPQRYLRPGSLLDIKV